MLLRTKALMFWLLVFPLVLATFFNLAFANIMKAERFEPITVGIVDDLNYQQRIDFKPVITTLAAKNKEQLLVPHYYQDESEAIKALKDNKIKGYYIVRDKIELVVKNNGFEQTILKQVVTSYYQTLSVVNNILAIKNDVINLIVADGNYFVAKPISNLDMMVIYYYSLLGMVCLYAGFLGVNAVNETEANLSKKGARLSVAPTNKLRSLVLSLAAGLTIQLVVTFILLAYLIYFLQVDFGSRLLYVFIMLAFGSIAGMAMGTLIGVSNRKSEDTKIGIVSGITMLCSFFAGLMMVQMKQIIANNAPLLAAINPVNMITDGLYALYYYEGLERYYMNIISLVIFSTIMITISYLIIRRKRYDSI